MICDEITPIIRPQIFDMQHGFKTADGQLGRVEHQVDGVYTDFSKAFDRVTHDLLCFELMRSFSEMMLARFWSYLIDRTKYVRFDDSTFL
jgi:hypothetical protein